MHKSLTCYILFLFFSVTIYNLCTTTYVQITSKLQIQNTAHQSCLHNYHINKSNTLILFYASHNPSQGALQRINSDPCNIEAPAQPPRSQAAIRPSPTTGNTTCSYKPTHTTEPAISCGHHNHKQRPTINMHTRLQAKMETYRAETTPNEDLAQHNGRTLQPSRRAHQENSPNTRAPTAPLEIRSRHSNDQVNPPPYPRISEPRDTAAQTWNLLVHKSQHKESEDTANSRPTGKNGNPTHQKLTTTRAKRRRTLHRGGISTALEKAATHIKRALPTPQSSHTRKPVKTIETQEVVMIRGVSTPVEKP